MEAATEKKTMTTQAIADRLNELCAKAEWETAYKELFSKDCVSIEPHATADFEKETKGLDAIKKKGQKFAGMVEAHHELKVSKPVVADNAIAFTMTMDVTMKGKGRMKSTELCVYQVKDGKIVSEQFFM